MSKTSYDERNTGKRGLSNDRTDRRSSDERQSSKKEQGQRGRKMDR